MIYDYYEFITFIIKLLIIKVENILVITKVYECKIWRILKMVFNVIFVIDLCN